MESHGDGSSAFSLPRAPFACQPQCASCCAEISGNLHRQLRNMPAHIAETTYSRQHFSTVAVADCVVEAAIHRQAQPEEYCPSSNERRVQQCTFKARQRSDHNVRWSLVAMRLEEHRRAQPRRMAKKMVREKICAHPFFEHRGAPNSLSCFRHHGKPFLPIFHMNSGSMRSSSLKRQRGPRDARGVLPPAKRRDSIGWGGYLQSAPLTAWH